MTPSMMLYKTRKGPTKNVSLPSPSPKRRWQEDTTKVLTSKAEHALPSERL